MSDDRRPPRRPRTIRAGAAPLACADARELVSAMLDGEADPAEQAELERHLGHCDRCAQWQAAAETHHRGLRVSLTPPVPDLADTIVVRVTGEHRRDPSPDRRTARRSVRTALAGAAALVLVGLLASVVNAGLSRSEPPPTLAIGSAAVELAQQSTHAVATVTIINGGGPDRLLGARSPAAGTTHLHGFAVTDGGLVVMANHDAHPVPSESTVVLRADGAHVMLADLDPTLSPGDEVDLVLVFERAGPQPVRAQVVPAS
ncbi:MAG: copper chaperone PCu(A)C [Acidimicrobiia bacterium]|nr:copper chaperone PCu(A)C [Acidimicrobiia bacterium]